MIQLPANTIAELPAVEWYSASDPETLLTTAPTILQADIVIAVSGSASAQTTATSPTMTSRGESTYAVPLTASDCNIALGFAIVTVSPASAVPQKFLVEFVAKTATDALATIETGQPAQKYNGPRGPGVYYDDGAANLGVTFGTDGTVDNPISSLTTATGMCGLLGENRIYMKGESTLTLTGQTLDRYEIIGLNGSDSNIVNLGTAASPSVLSNFKIYDCKVYGTHDYSDRLLLMDCEIDDAPAAEITSLHVYAIDCLVVGDITLDTSSDNLFIRCSDGVPGTIDPIINATGSAGTAIFDDWNGGVELASLSASHSVRLSGKGRVTFASSCNVNAGISLYGKWHEIDETAGMTAITRDGERTDTIAILVDTGATIPATITTAQNDLDIITGANGVLIDDDAITASKYDETTAFPITSADTGNTQIFRTGADGDTGETLSDEIAAVQLAVDAIKAATIIAEGTMQAGSTSTTAVLASATTITNDHLNDGAVIYISGGTGFGQTRLITDWVSSTDTATVGTWTTTPDNTSVYVVIPATNAASIITAIEEHGDLYWLTYVPSTLSTGTSQTFFNKRSNDPRELVQNDDYLIADNRPLRFVDDGTWGLTSTQMDNLAEIKVRITDGTNTITLTKSTSVSDWVEDNGSGSGTATIVADLPAASNQYVMATARFELQVKLASGSYCTLERSTGEIFDDDIDPN